MKAPPPPTAQYENTYLSIIAKPRDIISKQKWDEEKMVDLKD